MHFGAMKVHCTISAVCFPVLNKVHLVARAYTLYDEFSVSPRRAYFAIRVYQPKTNSQVLIERARKGQRSDGPQPRRGITPHCHCATPNSSSTHSTTTTSKYSASRIQQVNLTVGFSTCIEAPTTSGRRLSVPTRSSLPSLRCRHCFANPCRETTTTMCGHIFCEG